MLQPEIWQVDVETQAACLEQHLARLSEDELAYARAFRRDADRIRFVVSRGSLRKLVSERTGCAAATVEFTTGPHGKPALARNPAIHFNTSHSGRWVLHAFAGVPVGVDIEKVRPWMADIEDFALALSLDERDELMRQPPATRAISMTTTWVRKEAYVKALGEGLSREFRNIRIDNSPIGRPELAFDRNPPSAQQQWCFLDIGVDSDYRACFVHAGPPRAISIRHYRAASLNG